MKKRDSTISKYDREDLQEMGHVHANIQQEEADDEDYGELITEASLNPDQLRALKIV